MASRKKPEGIALLSMYNDDEEDEEDEDMEDINRDSQQLQQADDNLQNQEAENEVNGMQLDSTEGNLCAGEDDMKITNQASNLNYSSNALDGVSRPWATSKEHVLENTEVREIVEKSKHSIVDYGHDEINMSPEHEDPSLVENPIVHQDIFQQKEVARIVQALSPGLSINQPSDDVNTLHIVRDTIDTNLIDLPAVVPDDTLHLLDNFLPPPPKEKCSEELQKRIEKFMALKKVRRSFNAEVRNRKDYRNPDFLLHAVRYQDIDEIGSCFSIEVFNPSGYDKCDYYDEIELDMKRERDKKEQELRKTPKVEFVSGGSQPGLLVPPLKFSVPTSAASGLPPVPTPSDLPARDGRHSKKSKWDTMKIEPDILSTNSANPAVASAATTNVGSGNASYLEHKRREPDGRRSTDKIFDRKS